MDPPDDPPRAAQPKIWFQLAIPAPYTLQEIYDLGREKSDPTGDGSPILVLVNNSNRPNWYSHVDRERGMGFVQTCYWDQYFMGESLAAIAIEMCKVILHLAIVQADREARIEHHLHPTGCLFDHSVVKKDIITKLRGADLCDRCMGIARESGANALLLSSVFQLTQRLRERIVGRKQFLVPSKLRLYLKPDRLDFTWLGVTLKPDPSEYALYRLLLAHPEGIARAEMDVHRKELATYYPPTPLRDAAKVRRTLDLLCDLSDNSFNEKISRLNRKLRDTLLDAAEPYLAVKRGEVYAVAIDRSEVKLFRKR